MQTAGGEFVGGHAARVKGRVAVAEIRVQPPALVDQAILLLELPVEVGARRGREGVEIRKVELVADGKCYGLVKGGGGVLVVSENEGAVDHDPGLLKYLDRRLVVVVLQIPGFSHLDEVVPVQRLE